MTGAIVLVAALTTTALAQVSYKLYFDRGRPPSLLLAALTLFGFAQLGFFASLSLLDIGVVYMGMGLVQAMVLAMSRYFLGENVTRHHVVAVALIGAGLWLYIG